MRTAALSVPPSRGPRRHLGADTAGRAGRSGHRRSEAPGRPAARPPAERHGHRRRPPRRQRRPPPAGRPIATGVIEGACRHLIAGRFELAEHAGAEAMLKPRALSTPKTLTATGPSTCAGIMNAPATSTDTHPPPDRQTPSEPAAPISDHPIDNLLKRFDHDHHCCLRRWS